MRAIPGLRARTNLPGSIFRQWTRRRVLIGGLVACALLVLLSAGYVVEVERRYRSARESARLVQNRYATGAESGLTIQDLPTLSEDLERLETDLSDLDRLVDAPVLGRIARRAPVVGLEIKASQEFIKLGRELTAIARAATEIADETRLALESSGMSSETSTGPTWLDVVRENDPELTALGQRFTAVVQARAALDVDHLPPTAQATLPQLDRLLTKATAIRDEYFGLLPLLDPAFGADHDATYVILLQNREEIRPAGGFPGTFALVTLRNGQLATMQIDDIRVLDADYVARRTEPIVAPGPIREVLGQKEFLPHDALWSPDFAESAAAFEQMYAIAGWPELTGVIGMDDSVVGSILEIVGPYQLEINGRVETISADTFMSIIESERDQTWQNLAAHKQVVALLGSSLIDRIKATDFATRKRLYFALRDAAERRQLQVHLVNPGMQAAATARGWDGALQLDEVSPTLATTVAGLTGGKKALTLYQQSLVEIEPSPAGFVIRWTVTLDHRGDPGGNEVYNGYEYAWLSFYLPDGARLISTSRTVAPATIADDSRATSFGIGIMPGTVRSTTVTFEIGATDRLYLRRQAGFNDAQVRVVGDTGRCVIDWSLTLDRDATFDLSQCVVTPVR